MTVPAQPDPAGEAHWAPPAQAEDLKVGRVPAGALNLNVEGRQVSGPVQGFGQLWQKTFRAALPGAGLTPEAVLQTWRANFPRLQPEDNRFYTTPAGIQAGEVVLLNADTPGGPLSTGMLVLYVDATSFTLMTPEGHPEAGWVTFSAYAQAGVTVGQVQILARAQDPLYELGYRLAGFSKVQDAIWVEVLKTLGRHLGLADVAVTKKVECLDRRRQWSRAGNLRHNAQLRTLVYFIGTPLRWIVRSLWPKTARRRPARAR